MHVFPTVDEILDIILLVCSWYFFEWVMGKQQGCPGKSITAPGKAMWNLDIKSDKWFIHVFLSFYQASFLNKRLNIEGQRVNIAIWVSFKHVCTIKVCVKETNFTQVKTESKHSEMSWLLVNLLTQYLCTDWSRCKGKRFEQFVVYHNKVSSHIQVIP